MGSGVEPRLTEKLKPAQRGAHARRRSGGQRTRFAAEGARRGVRPIAAQVRRSTRGRCRASAAPSPTLRCPPGSVPSRDVDALAFSTSVIPHHRHSMCGVLARDTERRRDSHGSDPFETNQAYSRDRCATMQLGSKGRRQELTEDLGIHSVVDQDPPANHPSNPRDRKHAPRPTQRIARRQVRGVAVGSFSPAPWLPALRALTSRSWCNQTARRSRRHPSRHRPARPRRRRPGTRRSSWGRRRCRSTSRRWHRRR